jgi:hypothetical protein
MDWFMVGTRQLRQMIDGTGDTLPHEKSFSIALVQQRIGAHCSIDSRRITVQFHHHVGGSPNVCASNLGHNYLTSQRNRTIQQFIRQAWRAPANTTIQPLLPSVQHATPRSSTAVEVNNSWGPIDPPLIAFHFDRLARGGFHDEAAGIRVY